MARTRADDVAHRNSVQVSISDIASFLTENLGPKLTALIAGVDAKTISRWAGLSQAPREEAEKRLRSAFMVFQMLQNVEANPTVRAWFIGMNPQLDDASPAEALSDGHFKEVLAAARAFMAGG